MASQEGYCDVVQALLNAEADVNNADLVSVPPEQISFPNIEVDILRY